MVNKIKSVFSLPVIATAFVILFLGAPASKANAQVAFQAQVATPIGAFGFAAGPHPYYAGHGYGHRRAPYYASYRHGYRPYWRRRVYVAAPYPRWIYQRVYSPYPYSYSPPYAYCR